MSAKTPRFLVFGEALTDLVRTGDQSWHSVAGGSCWNVARVASSLGLDTGWCGAVSQDLFGREIVEHSQKAGLDLRFLQVVDKPPFIAVVHETQPPQYFFLGQDTADLAFDEQRLPQGWETHCEVAHFGSISLVRQPLGERLIAIAQRLKSRGVRISFDPNYRNLMGPDYPVLFESLVKLADVLKVSDEDLSAIYPGSDPAAVVEQLRGLNADASLLYTRGAGGMTLFEGATRIEQPALPVAVADTVGAGDSCLGGFIASRLLDPHASASRHLRFAAATAAVVCSRPGAYAPHRAEIEARLRADAAGA